MRNSQKHLFYRKPPDCCLWKWRKTVFGESLCELHLFSSDDARYILILAIFLQKVPQKFITSHNLIVIWWDSSKITPCGTRRRWNKYFQDFSYSILKEYLTVCFIVFDKKYKNQNIKLYSNKHFFIFCIAATSLPRSSSWCLVFCSKVPSQHFNVGSTLFQRCGSTLK